MSKDLVKKIAIGFSAACIGLIGVYFLWQQVKLENQLDGLRRFCLGLEDQTSIDQLQIRTAISPTLRLILMTPDSDGNQIGSIYIDGASRGSCELTLSRGRLTSRSFSFGYKDPNNPGQKLKPW